MQMIFNPIKRAVLRILTKKKVLPSAHSERTASHTLEAVDSSEYVRVTKDDLSSFHGGHTFKTQ